MHAVLEGVTKRMLNFCLNGKYRLHRFYLSTVIKDIGKMLLRIRPPHEFRRTPRPIETTLSRWKASEFRAWLLFYSIPILFEFLHRDYLHHLNLFVKSVHILLGSRISSDDLSAAKEMLTVFYQTMCDLYPPEIWTLVVHSVIHLVQCVENFSPL